LGGGTLNWESESGLVYVLGRWIVDCNVLRGYGRLTVVSGAEESLLLRKLWSASCEYHYTNDRRVCKNSRLAVLCIKFIRSCSSTFQLTLDSIPEDVTVPHAFYNLKSFTYTLQH
jgi:hypothetical protein